MHPQHTGALGQTSRPSSEFKTAIRFSDVIDYGCCVTGLYRLGNARSEPVVESLIRSPNKYIVNQLCLPI